jgi:hypothetical protein
VESIGKENCQFQQLLNKKKKEMQKLKSSQTSAMKSESLIYRIEPQERKENENLFDPSRSNFRLFRTHDSGNGTTKRQKIDSTPLRRLVNRTTKSRDISNDKTMYKTRSPSPLNRIEKNSNYCNYSQIMNSSSYNRHTDMKINKSIQDSSLKFMNKSTRPSVASTKRTQVTCLQAASMSPKNKYSRYMSSKSNILNMNFATNSSIIFKDSKQQKNSLMPKEFQKSKYRSSSPSASFSSFSEAAHHYRNKHKCDISDKVKNPIIISGRTKKRFDKKPIKYPKIVSEIIEKSNKKVKLGKNKGNTRSNQNSLMKEKNVNLKI